LSKINYYPEDNYIQHILSAFKYEIKQRNRRAPVTTGRNREPQGKQDNEKPVVSSRFSVCSSEARKNHRGSVAAGFALHADADWFCFL